MSCDLDEIGDKLQWLGSPNMEGDICRVLAQIPADICEWVLDNVVFHVDQCELGVQLPFKLLCRWAGTMFVPEGFDESEPQFCVRFILLRSELMEESDDVREALIAHEIGHAVSKHDIGSSVEEYQRHEDEADALVNQWGFRLDLLRERFPHEWNDGDEGEPE